MTLELQPITFAEAAAFIRLHHRHHLPSVGHKFSIAVNDGARVVGVVMVGRPVARHLANGWTHEERGVNALRRSMACNQGARLSPAHYLHAD
jgi:hypothetical protein